MSNKVGHGKNNEVDTFKKNYSVPTISLGQESLFKRHFLSKSKQYFKNLDTILTIKVIV